ncbi:hypothetical protein CHRYSEOSP005_08080 [Chryseobacterium sp. Alg-005]|uniref:hypothetical protein n=1 Tax=Chryseobacterium sp. Alg-005 TaxID=3159516 RepID=UPI0035558B62
MNNFTREQYDLAVAEWTNCCSNFSRLQSLIPTNYIFNLNLDDINWLKGKNQYKDFCVEMGVYENQLVMILVALDTTGHRKDVNEYPYAVLTELIGDLRLVETQEYTVINNAVLSKDLRKIDNDSDMFFPVANKPLMEQDKAVDAIELWRNEGVNWFFYECSEYEGTRIFKKFYVPADNLTPPKAGLNSFVCSFGLKYSDIYQRMLPTIIFISFYDDLTNEGSIETISNTYDWSQPCPPFCQL